MLERCPTCGKTIGTLMEPDPEKPGLIEILAGETHQGARIALTVALCLLLVLAPVATDGCGALARRAYRLIGTRCCGRTAGRNPAKRP
jgi:hypothetical protein